MLGDVFVVFESVADVCLPTRAAIAVNICACISPSASINRSLPG